MRKNNDNPLATAVNRAAGTAVSQDVAGTKGARVPPSRQGKKGVLLHVDPEIAKRLKLLAVEHDTTIETLGVEALQTTERSGPEKQPHPGAINARRASSWKTRPLDAGHSAPGSRGA